MNLAAFFQLPAAALYSQLGWALIGAALTHALLGRLRCLPRHWRQALALLGGIGLLLPLSGLSAAMVLHGSLMQPSIPLTLLAASTLAGLRPFSPRPATRYGLIAALSVFYLLALGLVPGCPFDPYAWGYSPPPGLWLLLAAAGLLAWRRGETALLLAATLALAAFAARLFGNLFDALADPLLLLWLLGTLLHRRRATPP